MFRVTLLFALALFGAAHGVSLYVPSPDRPITNETVFDCRSLPIEPQLHLHPTDCTRFIHCANGVAWDTPCAPCNVGDPACPDGYLEWDGSLGDNGKQQGCVWPRDSTCSNQGITPTTQKTTTVSVTPTSTTSPITETTTQIGDRCQADCDVEENDCRSWRYCKRTSTNPDNDDGVWVVRQCEAGYFFDPSISDRVGACSIWDDLDEDLQLEYNKQPRCNICTITPNPSTGNCTPGYIVTIDNVATVKQCTPPRLFDDTVKGCVHNCTL